MSKFSKIIIALAFLVGIVFTIFQDKITGSYRLYQLVTNITNVIANGNDQYDFQISAGITEKDNTDTIHAIISYNKNADFLANIQYNKDKYIVRSDPDSTKVFIGNSGLIISGKGNVENERFDIAKLLGDILNDYPNTSFILNLSWAERAGIALWAFTNCQFDQQHKGNKTYSVITFPEDIVLEKTQLWIGNDRQDYTFFATNDEMEILVDVSFDTNPNALQILETPKKIIHVKGDELNTAIYRGARRAGGILLENREPPKPDGVEQRWGKGFLTYVDNNRVLVAKGTHREIGEAHGTLLKNEIQKLVDATLYTICWIYTLENESWFIDDLRGAYKRESPFIPEKYQEEMTGMAQTSGISLEEIRLTNVFPALFHCSGFALFNSATIDGVLYHGRILDYITELGLQYYPLVQILHPDGSNAFANIGYAGFIGSVSGMNDQQLGFGEMGGGGVGDWDGMPMAFLMREGMERANTLDEALAIFRDTPRTCEYYYVISDGKIPDARGLATSPDMFDVIEPNQFHKLLDQPVENAVLMSSGDRYQKLAERVKAQHGKIDQEKAIRLMDRPVAMKSDLHNVLFAPQSLEFWVANAGSGTPACNEPYAHYSMTELLKLVE